MVLNFFALFALAVAIFIVQLRPRQRDHLADIPGPFWARYTNLWQVFYARLGKRHLAVHKAHQKYGPFVRISPNHVSVADFDLVPLIYSSGPKALDKSPYYKAFISGSEPSIFSTVDKHAHAQKRKFYTGTFAPKTVKQYGPLIFSVLQKFLEKLDEKCAPGDHIDLMKIINFFALDSLSTLAFGTSLETLERDSDVLEGGSEEGIIKTIDDREHRGAVIGWSPFLQRWSSWIPDPLIRGGKTQSNELDRIARAAIHQRLANGSNHVDVLGHLIAAATQKTEEPDINVLVSEAITVLIAGTDATTNGITSMIHLISTHPHVRDTLRAELEGVLGKYNTPQSDDQISNLPYLNACVYEALRYHSPTGMGLPRVSPGIEFKGHIFPPGTDLSVPTWTMSHDTVWGPDPYAYRPERWIENPSVSKYFMAFSSGDRSCLGRNLAIMDLKVIACSLFQRYDIEPRLKHLETVDKLMHKPIDESGWFRLKRRDI